MRFTKMEGLGNDYVYINGFEENIRDPALLAKKISDRHFGVGSDGLILIKPSEKADFTMEMYNADGTRSEMCGNGIRCVGKYVYDFGLTNKRKLAIETMAGIRQLTLDVTENGTKRGKVSEVTVDMGKPVLLPEKIPVCMSEVLRYQNGDRVLLPTEEKMIIKFPLAVDGRTYFITCVSMGNPHCVIFVRDVDTVPLAKLGEMFEYHPMFPNRTNVEFVQVMTPGRIRMRVWERGTGETLACGTGACAAAVAGVLNHKTDTKLAVELAGGTLNIRWDDEDASVYMKGSARTVFCGEMEYSEIF